MDGLVSRPRDSKTPIHLTLRKLDINIGSKEPLGLENEQATEPGFIIKILNLPVHCTLMSIQHNRSCSECYDEIRWHLWGFQSYPEIQWKIRPMVDQL